MKRPLLITLAVCCFAAKIIAQAPTLTDATITPKVGEGFLNQYAKALNVPDKSGGASQTWDYSGLLDSNAAVRLEAVTPASTPLASLFPFANLALKTANDSGYVYFNSQTNALNELGAAASDSEFIKYIKPKIYLPYPFTYNNSFSDSVLAVTSQFRAMLGQNFYLYGTDSLYSDGYGTLKVPGRIFTNALRVRYIETLSNTFDTLGLTITIQNRTLSYIYYAPGTHAPLLTINHTTARISESIGGFTLADSSITTSDISYFRNVILPVTFASFNASLANKTVLLQWQTAQEINTSNFNVQRSLNGIDFTNLTEMKATGNASGSRYNYTDQDYAKTAVPPSVFYRIKETDKDGAVYYSTTAVVHGNTSLLTLYPNPAKTFINLNTNGIAVADAINIYDAKGHLVLQYQNHPVSQPVNIASLTTGTYFVQVKIKDQTTTTTVIKQ